MENVGNLLGADMDELWCLIQEVRYWSIHYCFIMFHQLNNVEY